MYTTPSGLVKPYDLPELEAAGPSSGVVRDVAARPCCHTLGKGHAKELIRRGLFMFWSLALPKTLAILISGSAVNVPQKRA
jgi:hypothetical protein